MSNILKSKFLMDGAMGTELLSQGVSAQACLEELNLSQPSLILKIHKSYLRAGAEVIVSNTFGANRVRLSSKVSVEKANRAGVRLAHRASEGKTVLASMGPLGPKGILSLPQKLTIFQEQARALEKERPDGYLIETMTSLEEALIATQAVRKISRRPIATLLSFPKASDVTLSQLKTISKTLRKAGADALGFNCGTDTQEVVSLFEKFVRVDPGPWCVRPTAGLPEHVISPKDFAVLAKKLKKLGCQWIGGCCGTTPGHIKSLKNLI